MISGNFIFASTISGTPSILVICARTQKLLQEELFSGGFVPSALCIEKENLVVGLSKVDESDKVKTQAENGNLVKYSFDGVELVRELSVEAFGAVLSICYKPEVTRANVAEVEPPLLFAGINSKVVCFSKDLERLFETQTQIMVYKVIY